MLSRPIGSNTDFQEEEEEEEEEEKERRRTKRRRRRSRRTWPLDRALPCTVARSGHWHPKGAVWQAFRTLSVQGIICHKIDEGVLRSPGRTDFVRVARAAFCTARPCVVQRIWFVDAF